MDTNRIQKSLKTSAQNNAINEKIASTASERAATERSEVGIVSLPERKAHSTGVPCVGGDASPYNIDLEVIGEDRYHWILENETMGMKLEWAKTQAPNFMQHGAHIRLKLESSEKEDQQKMENLRQLLQELIQ